MNRSPDRRETATRRMARGQRHKVVVAGNGMVGFRFCRELTDRAPDRFKIAVYGEEERPAYDRIHLTRLFGQQRVDDLLLAPRAWYEHRKIDLHLNDPATAIDRRRRLVVSSCGREESYDTLILATGAEPVRPSIPGCDLPGVFAYRDATDALAIKLHARRASSAAVLGGGLLGLEAAKALADSGVETYVIEAAPHILARQLDPLSADIVHEQIERLGVRIAVERRVTGIRYDLDSLVVDLADSPPLAVDLVVIAAGVRPRDDVARAAGLAVDDIRGGVAVDDRLTTSDPRILAIGDCARHAGVSYGLVAPGYRMARVAVDSLCDGDSRFSGADLSCRLNVAGVEVAALGDYAGGGRHLVFQDGSIRRTLVIRDGCVTGLRAIGWWPNLVSIEQAMADKRPLAAIDIDRFTRTGDPWPDEAEVTTVTGYVDGALVCHCAAVSFGAVRMEIGRGCATLAELGAATGAGTICGSCRPVLAQICGDRSTARPRARWPLLVASLVALAGVGGFFSLAPLTPGDVGFAAFTEWLAQFWRDAAGKKLSGFTLVGIASLGLVLSLRRRVKRLRKTPLTWFRFFHASIGVLTLGFLVAHTGMHAGGSLNRWLFYTFLGVVGTGGLVGIATASSGRVGGGSAVALQRVRSLSMASHWLFLWVLPVLLTFHVIAVYYF